MGGIAAVGGAVATGALAISATSAVAGSVGVAALAGLATYEINRIANNKPFNKEDVFESMFTSGLKGLASFGMGYALGYFGLWGAAKTGGGFFDSIRKTNSFWLGTLNYVNNNAVALMLKTIGNKIIDWLTELINTLLG